jgi:hypothetical protein
MPSTYGTLARSSGELLPSVHDQIVEAVRVSALGAARTFGKFVAVAE